MVIGLVVRARVLPDPSIAVCGVRGAVLVEREPHDPKGSFHLVCGVIDEELAVVCEVGMQRQVERAALSFVRHVGHDEDFICCTVGRVARIHRAAPSQHKQTPVRHPLRRDCAGLQAVDKLVNKEVGVDGRIRRRANTYADRDGEDCKADGDDDVANETPPTAAPPTHRPGAPLICSHHDTS